MDSYITELFAFEQIETRGIMSRPVPAEFGVEGYFFPYERHFVYLRRLGNGGIGNVTILHVQMHQIARFKDDFVKVMDLDMKDSLRFFPR